MICFPNGKINLGLSVLEKRQDGFHNIESIIYPVTLQDVLEILPSKEFKLISHGLPIPEPPENLISKTWRMISDHFSLPPVEVHLLKCIPIGSGLGGGSSDAAHFIKVLNDYFCLDISKVEMKNLAFQIGSDCPFFIENEPAIIHGRGEIIKKTNLSLKGKYLVIVFPGIGISTKEAYSSIVTKKPSKPNAEIIKQPIDTWKFELVNDFEKHIFELYPQIGEIKKELYKIGALYASMTGSGSAVYGIFNQKPQLNKFIRKYNFWEGIIPD